MRDTLQLEMVRREGEPCVAVIGELDMSNAERIGPEMLLQDAHAAGHAHLDLTATRFMDSTGLRRLLQLHREAAARGVGLVIHVRNGSPIERVIHLVGADDVLSVVAEGERATG